MAQKITIKINNQRLEGFDNVSASRNIENFCANFSFQAFSENKVILPFNPSQPCEVYVEDNLFINGTLDKVNIGYKMTSGNASHFFNLSGRDQTSILVDNSIEGNFNFTAPINIVDILQFIVKDFTTRIGVIAPLFPIPDFQKEELLSAKEGQNLFKFMDNLARQRGILLMTDENGNIILGTQQRAKYRAKLVNEINNDTNNILQGSLSRDYSDRYHRYKTYSQSNMSSDVNTSPDYNITGIYADSGTFVNADKYIDIQSEVSVNQSSNNTRAEWEGKVRAARSEIYTVKVVGFIADELEFGIKDFWEPNRLIDIKDDLLGINTTLLIRSVNYDYTSTTGPITTLELVDKNAYLVGGS